MTSTVLAMPTRRDVLQGAASTIATAALATRAAAAQGLERKPNILFILADDLGFADLSCYGRREYRTPHLDRLAATGLRFTDGYSNSPVCSPTRVALITGRYQYRLRAGLEEPIVHTGKIWPGDISRSSPACHLAAWPSPGPTLRGKPCPHSIVAPRR